MKEPRTTWFLIDFSEWSFYFSKESICRQLAPLSLVFSQVASFSSPLIPLKPLVILPLPYLFSSFCPTLNPKGLGML
jgi:hypothetical protein